MILSATYTDIPWQKSGPILYRGGMQECFSMIREDGFDGVEMHIHDPSLEDPEEIRRILARSGLILTSVGTGSAYSHDGLSLTASDPLVRQAAIERVLGHVDLVSHFPGAVVILGLIRGKIEDCPSKELYDERLASSLRVLEGTAARRGVTLVLEMINRRECDALKSIQEGISFLDAKELPGIKLHIDTYHMSIEEKDAPSAIRKAGSRIGHVHLADDDRHYPGHGSYPFHAVLQALKDISYPGALAVEALSLPDMRTAGHRSAGHIGGLMEAIGL